MCGGHGYFGRLLVEDLLARPGVELVIAGRRPLAQLPWSSERVTYVRADQHDRSATGSALQGCAVAVHAAGPYQGLAPTLLQFALERRIPYVDLADDLGFYREVLRSDAAARTAGVPVVCGASFFPGLSCALVALLRPGFERIHSVRIFAAPGTRSSRGRATFESLLSGAGRPLHTPGTRRARRGWSEPETIELPPPIGRRRTYLAIEVADFEIVPRCFGASAVEFRAGSEFSGLNRCLAGLAALRASLGFPRLERWHGFFSPAIRLLGLLGTEAGAGAVEVRGERGGRPTTEWLAILAPRAGPRIPALPAAIAARAILERRVEHTGVLALHEALAPARLVGELEARGLELWSRDAEGPWRRMTPVTDPSPDRETTR